MLRTIILNLTVALAFATQLVISHPQSYSALTFAGVELPDTPSVHASLQFINAYLDEPTFNHVVRSTVFALSTLSKIVEGDPSSPLAGADAEVLTVSALLHDMSWNVSWGPTHQFVSQDKRFEVDGANVARQFLSQLKYNAITTNSSSMQGSGWDDNRLQLVWDSIALHTTVSIGQYKQAEVVLSGYGIFTDVVGIFSDVDNTPLPGIPNEYKVTKEEYDQVYAAIPGPGFTTYIKDIGIGLCRQKPETTYDNIFASFGVEWLDGYSLAGHTVADLLIARAEHEGLQNFTDKVSA